MHRHCTTTQNPIGVWLLMSRYVFFLFFSNSIVKRLETENERTAPQLSEKSVGTYAKTFERVGQCVERFGESCW